MTYSNDASEIFAAEMLERMYANAGLPASLPQELSQHFDLDQAAYFLNCLGGNFHTFQTFNERGAKAGAKPLMIRRVLRVCVGPRDAQGSF